MRNTPGFTSADRSRGSVLILALWTVIFLAILAVGSSFSVHQKIRALERIEERETVAELGYSGAALAIDELLSSAEKETTPDTDSLNDFWADDVPVFKDVSFPRGTFSVKYSHINNVTGLSEEKYGLIDEERKININYADKDILARLFMAIGGRNKGDADTLAYNIIDWRDSDDSLGEAPNMSESAKYANEGRPYSPANTPFRIPEELLLVSGFDKELFLRIRDHITVFGSGKININTASDKVLLACGFDQNAVAKIVGYRSGTDLLEGTADDNIFTNVREIVSSLESVFGIMPKAEKDAMISVVARKIFVTRSTTFTAIVSARLKRKSTHGTIVCTFDRNGTIKYWGSV